MSHLKCSFTNLGVKNPKFFPAGTFIGVADKIFIGVPPFNGTSPVLKNSCFTFAYIGAFFAKFHRQKA